MPRRRDLLELTILGGATACLLWPRRHAAEAQADERFPIAHTDAEWRKLLNPAAYEILRQQGTEAPYSSPLDLETRTGLYSCLGCGQHLYSSATKYDSHTGWPSFWKPLSGAVGERHDTSFDMIRTEIHCARCGGHLGHVFPDGPPPTGLRYCMNGAALSFQPA
ncbi:MAG TPA: peptide-methionine (R)-S-oxide reductase MsrB [Acidocella sp.]|nr:peptide-methionine (R)-S-oxide reductase MsrB [Acidocella sp.]